LLKKENNLTALEKILGCYGDGRVCLAFDPRTKVWPAFVTGKRTKESIEKLVEKVKEVTGDTIPLFPMKER